jgi:hypothetical protein
MELKMNRADRRKAKKSGPEKNTPSIAQQSSFHQVAKSVAIPPTRNNRAGSRKP